MKIYFIANILQRKKRLITNVKREIGICLCTHFDNRITARLSEKSSLLAELSSASRAGNKITPAKSAYALSHKNWYKIYIKSKG